MPRPLRIHFPGAFYHVTLRGNHRQPIFRFDSDRLLLNAIVATKLERYSARVHAYCWMTNHIHLLMQVSSVPLGSIMRDIASGYARAFQLKMDTTGHLFERRYHAVLVDADAYLLELVRYIHQNPVRARIAPDVGTYRWSSHQAYIGARTEPWVTSDFALRMLARTRVAAIEAYRRLVNCDPDLVRSPFATMRDDGLPVLGDDEFLARVTGRQARHTKQITLEALIDEACEHFAITRTELESVSREKVVVDARGWIAREAVTRGAATLSEVARTLGKERSTLRHAMQRLGRVTRG